MDRPVFSHTYSEKTSTNLKKIIVLGSTAIIVVLASAVYFAVLRSNQPPADSINSFEECAAAGRPVLESYPRQCRTPEGRMFAENIGNELEKLDLILYYYNPELDKDQFNNILCSKKGLAPVERKNPITITPIQDTIKLLLKGQLTVSEQAMGIETEYPLEGFELKGASLNDGVLTLEFNDPNNQTVGGACRVGILWFQIEQTAKQFPEVQTVRFLPEDIFQP